MTRHVHATASEFANEARRLRDRIALRVFHSGNKQALSVAGGSDVEESTLLCQTGGNVADGGIGINIVVEEIDEIFLTENGAGLP